MHEIFGLLTRCRDCGRVFRVNAAVSSPKRAANVRLTFCCWLGTGKKESAVDKGKEIPAPAMIPHINPRRQQGRTEESRNEVCVGFKVFFGEDFCPLDQQ